MKTSKITKARIANTLRSGNRTEIFKIAHLMGIDTKNRAAVADFVRNNAPSQRVTNSIYSLVHKKNYQNRPFDDHYNGNLIVNTRVGEVIAFAKMQKKEGWMSTNYGKVLVAGNRNIYWAHPVYKHDDYNKGIAFENTETNRQIAKKINKYLGY